MNDRRVYLLGGLVLFAGLLVGAFALGNATGDSSAELDELRAELASVESERDEFEARVDELSDELAQLRSEEAGDDALSGSAEPTYIADLYARNSPRLSPSQHAVLGDDGTFAIGRESYPESLLFAINEAGPATLDVALDSDDVVFEGSLGVWADTEGGARSAVTFSIHADSPRGRVLVPEKRLSAADSAEDVSLNVADVNQLVFRFSRAFDPGTRCCVDFVLGSARLSGEGYP